MLSSSISDLRTDSFLKGSVHAMHRDCNGFVMQLDVAIPRDEIDHLGIDIADNHTIRDGFIALRVGVCDVIDFKR